jgi:hypothetical protein
MNLATIIAAARAIARAAVAIGNAVAGLFRWLDRQTYQKLGRAEAELEGRKNVEELRRRMRTADVDGVSDAELIRRDTDERA